LEEGNNLRRVAIGPALEIHDAGFLNEQFEMFAKCHGNSLKAGKIYGVA
jgi:hypothetical protein